MKKTIYLHIGTEKTGTKSIQHFCVQNTKFLNENNLFYPYDEEKKYVFNVAHWPLAAVLTKNNKFVPEEKLLPARQMYELFVRDIAQLPYDNIIVSAEPFSVNVTDKNSILELKRFLNDFNVKIIVYLRRQDHYFISHTSTKVKGGVYFPKNQFLTNEVLLNKERYDYELLLDKWAEVFGVENIIAKIFERNRLKNNNIVDDFFDIFNLNVSHLENASIERNVSLSLDSLHFLNMVNGKFDLNAKERTKIFSLLEKRKSDFKIKDLISPKERIEIIKYYEESNNKVAEKYFGKKDGGLFEEPLPNISSDWQQFKGLTNHQIIEICEYLLESFKIDSRLLADSIIKTTINLILKNGENSSKYIYRLQDQILTKGNLITRFEKKDDGWHLISEGKDPNFLLPNFSNFCQFTSFVVEIKLTVPDDTFIQLFYKSDNTNFNEENSYRKNVKKGFNHLVFKLETGISITALRFDPGNVEGEYIIHDFVLETE